MTFLNHDPPDHKVVYYRTQSISSSVTSFSDGSDFKMSRRTSSSEEVDIDSILILSRESSFSDENITLVEKRETTLYQMALDYCNEENLTTDLQMGIYLLKKAALQDESRASMKLGQIYQNMSGMNEGLIYALFWFQHAMRIDSSLKYECTGICTKIRRNIVTRDCGGTDSFESFLSLAKQKIPVGQYLVGLSYEMGLFDGIQANAEKAFSWYKKFGRQMKDADIFFDLGMRYSKGIGCQQSIRKAISCLKKAEILEHENARIELGLIYFQKRKYTRAIGYLSTELDKDDPRVPFTLGEMYYEGLGFPEDHGKAMVHYENAARSDYVEAQVILGRIYAGEFGDEENLTEAFVWFKKAAKQSHILGQYNLAILYFNGQGVRQNKTKAFKVLSRLANLLRLLDKGDRSAVDFDLRSNVEYRLGRMYFEGVGTEQNKDEGVKWLARASAHGHSLAQSYVKKKKIA